MSSQRNRNYKNRNSSSKKPWYNWLINYILNIVKKNGGGIKDKIMSLFKTNKAKNYSKPTKLKNKKNQSEGKVIKRVEGKINRDIRNLYHQEKDYYEPARVGNFDRNNYILNMNAKVIKIKASQPENTLIKLKHT